MSTTTNFKRIALVAVAALGMGVLSSVPAQATWSGAAGSQLTITTTAGTGTLSGAASDSTTAGTISVTGLALTASTDSYSVTAVNKSKPAEATATPRLILMLVDTATSTSAAAPSALSLNAMTTTPVAYTPTVNQLLADSGTTITMVAGASTGYVNSKFKGFLESAVARVAGTYVYTVIVTPNSVSGNIGTAQTADITITVAALASASLVANAANSTAFIGTAVDATADAAVSAVATSSDTPVGYLTVSLRNAAGSTGTAARESVTITTTIGQVGSSTNRGRSVVLKYDSVTNEDYNIYADGTAGTGTITISTPSVSFATKTVSFYSVAPKTLVSTVLTDALKAGANTGALGVKALDANGIAWTGTLYVYSDTVGTISNDASSCSYDATDARHECSITGVANGTAKLTVRDAATVATATVSATAVTMTVNTAAAAKFTMTFDKATYAPGEKATLVVTVLDSAGKSVGGGQTFANLFDSDGLVSSTAPGNGSDAAFTTPAASVTVGSLAAASSAYTTTTPVKTYTFYMPTNGGTIKVTATGGASLPTAGQVAVVATATITDNAAAALAAVNALATTVAALRTLITTLTNLVLKIQKKVKA